MKTEVPRTVLILIGLLFAIACIKFAKPFWELAKSEERMTQLNHEAKGENQALCESEARRMKLHVVGCWNGPNVADSEGVAHTTTIVNLIGLGPKNQCQYVNELAILGSGLNGQPELFPRYLNAVYQITENFKPSVISVQGVLVSSFIRPKLSLKLNKLVMDFSSPSVDGKIILNEFGKIVFSKFESHVLSNRELIALVYNKVIPALISAGYIGKTTKILPPDLGYQYFLRYGDGYGGGFNGARSVECIKHGGVGDILLFGSDGMTELTLFFGGYSGPRLKIPIVRKKLVLNGIKPSNTVYPCKADPSEIKYAPFRRCQIDSDCVLDHSRRMCADQSVNKKYVETFNGLSPIQGCAATTSCSAVKCMYNVCVPKNCSTGDI